MKDRGDGAKPGGPKGPARGGRGPTGPTAGSTQSIWSKALQKKAEGQREEPQDAAEAAPRGRPFPSRDRDPRPTPAAPRTSAGDGRKTGAQRDEEARDKARSFGLFGPAAEPSRPQKKAFWLPREGGEGDRDRPRAGGFAPRRRANARQVVDDDALVVQPFGSDAAEEAKPRVGALKLALGEIAEVTVEKLVAGGEGLGRHEGVPVFVPRSAPGDRLRVRLVERHGDYGRAEILEVLTPGPGRRLPPCPYFERCGGCDLQHLEDGLQSKLKAAAVLETVVRMGKVEVPANLKVVTGASWGYRLRAQLHTGRPETPEGLPQVGYFARRSKELVAVDTCPILVPELEALLPQLPALLAEGRGDLPHRLDLAAGQGGEISTAPVAGSLPHGPIALEVGGFRYAFDARTFFQGHRGLVDDLVAAALGSAEWTGDFAVDLYAGVGLFSLPLATRYRQVLAVEGDRVAARYARTNVKSRPAGESGRIKVIDQAVESWITELPAGVDRVIADPPRTGLKGPVVRALLERKPQRVTYVSCHPATFARDLRALGQVYRLEGLTLLDLFPQTGHMELVGQLVVREEE